MDFPKLVPSPAPPSGAVPLSTINSQLSTPLRLIPREAWIEHMKKPDRHLSLPDGTPLNLTASGVDFFQRVTGSLLWPNDFHEASLFLWLCSRTPEELEALWEPEAPAEEPDEFSTSAPAPRMIPGLVPFELARRARAWREAVIPPGAALYAQNLAVRIWSHHNGTAVEVDEAGLPDDGNPDEKKNPVAAGSTGSSAPSTPSAPATLESGAGSSTGSRGAPFSPLTEHGSPPTDSPSSPLSPVPAATP